MAGHRRWIMHVDMDAFYASVEQRDHPEWRGKPVIVGGKGKRSVAATASYEARAYGVHSAMSISEAKRRCPDGIFVEPRFEVYHAISDEIHAIMLHYAEAIEPIALDEAFMDISGMGSQYRTLGAIGRAIKAEIREKAGLVASVGIAPNKFLAKMASDMGKPDGLFIIPYGRERAVLAPLPVRKLWGVGPVTARRLQQMGFETIGDMQNAPVSRLRKVLGNQAVLFHQLALGIDFRPVEAEREVKSIGDESTMEKDIFDRAEIERQIALHSDVVARRLRKKGLSGQAVTLKVRFASFRTLTRSMTLSEPTRLAEDIEKAARILLQRIPLSEGVRLIGVTASRLVEGEGMMNLFSESCDRKGKAAAVVDALQEQFGERAIRRGLWVEQELKEKAKKSEKNSQPPIMK